MISSLLISLLLFMLPFALIGLLVFVKVLLLPMKAPADSSNRIAHLRLWWLATNSPEYFVPSQPWLAMDERDLIKQQGEKDA
jgi:hypothetical protein